MSIQNYWSYQANGETQGYFNTDFLTTLKINQTAQNETNCSGRIYVGMPKTKFTMNDNSDNSFSCFYDASSPVTLGINNEITIPITQPVSFGSFTLARTYAINIDGQDSISLNDLTDITFGTLVSGDVIKYDSGTSQWINAPDVSGPATLSALTDVNIPTPANGEVLTYNGGTTKWISSGIPAPNIGLNDLNDVTLTAPGNGNLLQCNNLGQFINVSSINSASINGVFGYANGGTGQNSYVSGQLLETVGAQFQSSGKIKPSGDIVGTSDNQTLSNKSINGSSNTLSNISTASIIGLPIFPVGAIVGTTDSQVLVNKTLTDATNSCRATQVYSVDMPAAAPSANQKIKTLSSTTSSWIDDVLSGLNDVTIAAPINNQYLQYSSGISKWINADPIGEYCNPTGEIYSTASNSTVMAVQNTWYPATMATPTIITNNSDFVTPQFTTSAGLLQYLGATNDTFHCAVSLSSSTANAGETYEIAIGVSGTTPFTGSIYSLEYASNNVSITTAIHKVLTLTTTNTVTVLLRCTSSASRTITSNNINLVLMNCCSKISTT